MSFFIFTVLKIHFKPSSINLNFSYLTLTTLEAFSVNNGFSSIIEFFFCDPHFAEG